MSLFIQKIIANTCPNLWMLNNIWPSISASSYFKGSYFYIWTWEKSMSDIQMETVCTLYSSHLIRFMLYLCARICITSVRGDELVGLWQDMNFFCLHTNMHEQYNINVWVWCNTLSYSDCFPLHFVGLICVIILWKHFSLDKPKYKLFFKNGLENVLYNLGLLVTNSIVIRSTIYRIRNALIFIFSSQ